jgi:orotidine-5'-phosphate decarboxylase
MPRCIFLVPGFGAQGGTADDIRAAFNSDDRGAIITASRSVLYAFAAKDDRDWPDAVGDAARRFAEEVRNAITSA